MKIAILADVHDNFNNLVSVLKRIRENKEIEQIIFLGDFINNGIAKFFASFNIPTYAIWGNNDGDKCAITKTALAPKSNLTISNNVYDFLEFDGRRMFITHYPDLARPMAKSGEYDVVFYGHNHLQNKDKIVDCLIVNPGEISGHKSNRVSFAIYDTKINEVEFVEIKDQVNVMTEEASKYLKELKFEFSKSKDHQY